MSDEHSVPTDLVTIRDAARIAAVSTKTIKRRIARGELAVYGSPRAQRVSCLAVAPRVPQMRKSVYYTPGDVPPIYLYPPRKPAKEPV